jgi:hypothetical protein
MTRSVLLRVPAAIIAAIGALLLERREHAMEAIR